MKRVFLSYDRRDSGKAEAVALALEKAGHTVWWDRQIKGGSRFSKEIERALAEAEIVVVLWSAHSVESDWVRDEAAAGRDAGQLVPVTLDGSPPPLGFRQFQTIDLVQFERRGPAAFVPLLEAIEESGGSSGYGRVPQSTARSPARRKVLVGLGATLAGTAGAIAFWQSTRAGTTNDPAVAALIDQAWQSWAQGTNEGNSQAIGLYRRATELAPDNPDAWGFLGCAYGDRGHNWVTGAERAAVWQRAQAAGGRALKLDPKNAYGRAAIAYARPSRGNWALMEREFRRAQEDQPGKWLIVYSLALLLGEVGRFSEAARLFGSLKDTAPTATQYHFHVQSLWASGQLDQAERLLEEATEIFSTYSGIWWQRFHMLLHGGRASAAIAHLEDRGSRPASTDEKSIELATETARASLSRGSAELEAVMRKLRLYGAESVSQAQFAMVLASFLGAGSLAMELAQALFFSRGFVIPDYPPAPGSALQVTLDEREPRVLFLPSTKQLRRTEGFGRLVADLGLERYWQASRSTPDYRKLR